MNSLDSLDHLARILLSVSWQVSILILLVWIVSLITRKSSSEFRYWLWIIVLVRLCIPVGLEIPFGIPTADNLLKEPVLSLVQTPFLPERYAAAPSGPKITETTAKPVQPLVTPPSETPSWQFSINHLIAFTWLAGIIVIWLAIVWRVTRLGKRLRKCPPILNPDVQLRLAQLKTRMKITQPVGLFYLDLPGITSPAVSGAFHPRIYLPRTMDDSWPSKDLESVLLHELAHIRCYDAMVNWLQIVIQTVYFFHPLVWLANWKIRQLREEVCDDLAIHHYAFKRERYTQGMINVIKNRMREPAFTFLGLGFIERKVSLSERVRRIMNDRYKKYSRLTVTSVLILSAIGLVSISLSSVKSSSAKISNGKEFSIRKIQVETDVGSEGAVSPDGRYLSYVDWDTGDLAIYEIATGNKRRLTNKGSWDESDEYALYSRWSPDGKLVAYTWDNKTRDSDLRIVGLDGSKPRTLYSNESTWVYTYGWSPDGKQIIACLDKHQVGQKRQVQIVLVSTADGSVRVLKTMEKGGQDHFNFSPDGRYIVYDFPQKGDSPGHDISLLSTDGSREIPLVEYPANDYVLGWAPDGKNILFASDRTGNFDAWVIQVANGKPQGAPKLVKQDMGQFRPMGFTRDGSFYYVDIGLNIFDVYTATLDPETGEILVPPEKAVKRFEGYNQYPSYSPDGKYLVYISMRSRDSTVDGKSAVLCIRSLETGKEREFSLNYLDQINQIASPRWSPDCRSIIFCGKKENRWSIIRIDAQTGDITPIVIREDGDSITSPDWSRDGKAIFYVLTNGPKNLGKILVRDIESGTEKELLSAPVTERIQISLSPDGRSLALLNFPKKRVLKVMSADGGEPRELYTWEQTYGQWGSITWSADGKYILFSRQRLEKEDFYKWDLWRIPVKGGEPQNLGLTVTGWGIRHLCVHPDGRQIAWSAMTSSQTGTEMWVMENFLSK